MPLKNILRDKINRQGPVSIAEFMTLALSHPEHGYYMTRDPFGRVGDFTTAPEISQMFGEMIGVWAADTWLKMGSPAHVTLLECGPGRGTLMSDMMRATKGVQGFHEAVNITLMEISPVLKQAQADALKPYDPQWIEDLEGVSRNAPVLLIANEFLDALPVRQFVGKDEVCVDYQDGEFVFCSPPNPPVHGGERDTTAIIEKSPARENFVKQTAVLLKQTGGAGLFIDYGYTQGHGDTLQAVYKHQYCSPLDHIGNADITAHVDFGALQSIMPSRMTTQGHFLKAMGILYRAEALSRNVDPQTIASALHRLTHRDEMGELFKVMGVSHDTALITSGF